MLVSCVCLSGGGFGGRVGRGAHKAARRGTTWRAMLFITHRFFVVFAWHDLGRITYNR